MCTICKTDTSNAVAIACGICYASTHASCLGFKGSGCDKIMAHSGIKYFCSDHEKMSPSVVICKFRKLKSQFDILNKCFNEMKEVLDDEKLFLRSLLLTEAVTQTEAASPQLSNNVDLSIVPSNTRVTRAVLNKRKGVSLENAVEKKKSKSSDKDVDPLNNKSVPLKSYSSVTAQGLEFENNDSNVINDLANNAAGSGLRETPLMNVDDDELVALAPPKVVFLSNFPKNYEVEKIQTYIANRLNSDDLSHLFVSKMTLPENRAYSSFKITVRNNDLLGDVLLNKQFWPRNTFVKPFLRRARQAVISD